MQKITPCLWFNYNAEEAVNFYVSVFDGSKIKQTSYYGEEGPGPVGAVMTIVFELEGQEFMALNGGPDFPFTPAISLMVRCKNQDEIDRLWRNLSAGGQTQQCGWLRDKYGVSWQIVPKELGELMTDKEPERSRRVMAALLQMSKIDIQRLKDAREHQVV